MASTLQYSPLPERAAKAIEKFLPSPEKVQARYEHFASCSVRPTDRDGSKEVLRGVEFTHHFVDGPGDYETVSWHYVTAGDPKSRRPPIVFLHGIPDSWFQWHPQMVALSPEYYCIAVDLKGYGQSEKRPGNYQHEAVSEQLYGMLQQIKVLTFFLVTHDRGTVQADFITANHPESVLGYARGEQHLYHFHPSLAPQGDIFKDAPYTGMMEDPKHFVLYVYTWITKNPIDDEVMSRVIQEFSYPGIVRAVPRYFNSSTFRQEWLARRNRLLAAWKCPVLIMQGYESKTQPREFYEKSRQYIPNAKAVEVEYVQGGHFWTLEDEEGTTRAIRHMLSMSEQ